MLLVGAGLLIKSFAKLQSVDPGFTPDNVLTAQIALPAARYPDAPRVSRVLDAARSSRRARFPASPSAASTTNVPFNGNVSSGSYSIVGRAQGPGDAAPHGRQEVVGGDYFKAMHIPLLQGRVFNDGDTADSAAGLRRRRVPGEEVLRRPATPLGQQIQRGGPTSPKFTIVGVVGTSTASTSGMPVTKERLYYPLTQQVQGRGGGWRWC